MSGARSVKTATHDDPMQQPDAPQARQILIAQSIIGLILVVMALPFGGSVARSVLIGSGSCLLANMASAAWIFRAYRAQEREGLVLRLYTAEILKIASVLALFTLAWTALDDLNIPALLGAYVATQVMSALIAAHPGNQNLT